MNNLQKDKNKHPEIYDLTKLSVAPPYFFVLFHPSTWHHLFRYLRTVIKDFFWLQFKRKLGLSKTKIISVDHPLDDKVPFCPEKIDVYLDFINFWVRPLTLVTRRCKKDAVKIFNDYFDLINECYRQAAEFYRFRMSTTRRPQGLANRKFFWLKTLDPHFLCVPSLHVSIMVLTCTYFKRIFNQQGFSEEEKSLYNGVLYKGAIEIAETVLYIKQHSVNCIASALYMMQFVLAGEFSVQDSVNFINAMFSHAPKIADADRKAINEHLNYLFEQLLLEGVNDYDWLDPLKRWILNYEADQTEEK